jgi:hypothetical protein
LSVTERLCKSTRVYRAHFFSIFLYFICCYLFFFLQIVRIHQCFRSALVWPLLTKSKCFFCIDPESQHFKRF